MTIPQTPTSYDSPSSTVRTDELVVGLPYQKLVWDRLSSWGATPATPDVDSRLGLALIRLDAAAAAQRLADDYPDWTADVIRRAKEDGYEPSAVDLTVQGLEHAFRQDHGGWSPTLGKNRVMSRVTGSYTIGIGGEGEPPAPVAEHAAVPLRKPAPGQGARVGLIDTKLRTHEWLAGGYVAAADDLRTGDSYQATPFTADHSTFVAGLLLRQAPGAVVELHAGLQDDGTSDSWSIAKAIARLAGRGANVINLSLGCQTDDGKPPLVLAAAVAALGPDTVVVAAAGNHRPGADLADLPPAWPAALDHVVAVGAFDTSGPASFSPTAPWVDAYAPGVQVVSTYVDGGDGTAGFARWSGTSFAAAAVSGAIAAEIKPGVGAQQAWQVIRDNAPIRHGTSPFVPLRPADGWPADGSPKRWG